jgi:DNA-binding PadR family transcriptional regulator
MPAIRISPHWFHILLALADHDRHGQGIMQTVLEETHERVRLWPAMLYRNLDQLCDAGLVEELPPRPTTIPGSPRFFRITPAGRRACAAEAERLAAVVATARSKHLLRKA